METLINLPLKFSSQAVSEIKRLMDEPGFDKNKFLRIGVKGGGCSGLSYILGFDDRQDKDEIYETDAFPFLMNPSHSIYLNGMEIHWEDGLNARGFSFIIQTHPKPVDAGLHLQFKYTFNSRK